MQTRDARNKRLPPKARLEMSCNSEDPEPPSSDSLSLWINTALAIESRHASSNATHQSTYAKEPHKPYWVSIYIVDEAEAKQYNDTHRNKPYATNVLSFSHNLPGASNEIFLGDILACAPVIRREARKQMKPLSNHWAHMLVHSTLHLLGYDHQDEHEANQMERLETQILDTLNIPNPYETLRAIDYE